MSVPQTPTRSTSTTTSPGRGTGGSTWRTTELPGPVSSKARTSASSDHGLALLAEPGDAELHHVAGGEPDLRVHAHPHPRRGAGVDQVTCLEHHELAEVVHEEVGVEDHRGGAAALPALAVHIEPQVEGEDVLDLLRGHQPGP